MRTKIRPGFALLSVVCVAVPAASPAIEVQTGTFEGVRVISLSGEFLPQDDPEQFARTLATFGPDIVTFNSFGGNIYSAMSFGRAIRNYGATTVQFRRLECASACALVFLGGAQRYAEPGSIGVHKSSFAGDYPLSAEDAVSAVQSATADVLSYLIEMGVDPGLLQLALRYESRDIRYLSGSEMAAHGVITGDLAAESQTATAGTSTAPIARQAPPTDDTDRLTSVDDARSGLVRRPKGYALIMSEPATEAQEIRMLPNGTPVAILGTIDRWYRVQSGSDTGWMHHTWVKVAEFHDAGFEAKHVQIKSFDNGRDAQAYLTSTPFPLDVYLATNGWLAVTLDGTFTDAEAADVLSRMKAADLIPSDSFQTYGNTYVQKLCCE